MFFEQTYALLAKEHKQRILQNCLYPHREQQRAVFKKYSNNTH